jgi:uncharacterized protein YdeI (YjbR/CyaY-like superfamily)
VDIKDLRLSSGLFSALKRSQSSASRIEKWLPQILAGKGLNDE